MLIRPVNGAVLDVTEEEKPKGRTKRTQKAWHGIDSRAAKSFFAMKRRRKREKRRVYAVRHHHHSLQAA